MQQNLSQNPPDASSSLPSHIQIAQQLQLIQLLYKPFLLKLQKYKIKFEIPLNNTKTQYLRLSQHSLIYSSIAQDYKVYKVRIGYIELPIHVYVMAMGNYERKVSETIYQINGQQYQLFPTHQSKVYYDVYKAAVYKLLKILVDEQKQSENLQKELNKNFDIIFDSKKTVAYIPALMVNIEKLWAMRKVIIGEFSIQSKAQSVLQFIIENLNILYRFLFDIRISNILSFIIVNTNNKDGLKGIQKYEQTLTSQLKQKFSGEEKFAENKPAYKDIFVYITFVQCSFIPHYTNATHNMEAILNPYNFSFVDLLDALQQQDGDRALLYPAKNTIKNFYALQQIQIAPIFQILERFYIHKQYEAVNDLYENNIYTHFIEENKNLIINLLVTLKATLQPNKYIKTCEFMLHKSKLRIIKNKQQQDDKKVQNGHIKNGTKSKLVSPIKLAFIEDLSREHSSHKGSPRIKSKGRSKSSKFEKEISLSHSHGKTKNLDFNIEEAQADQSNQSQRSEVDYQLAHNNQHIRENTRDKKMSGRISSVYYHQEQQPQTIGYIRMQEKKKQNTKYLLGEQFQYLINHEKQKNGKLSFEHPSLALLNNLHLENSKQQNKQCTTNQKNNDAQQGKKCSDWQNLFKVYDKSIFYENKCNVRDMVVLLELKLFMNKCQSDKTFPALQMLKMTNFLLICSIEAAQKFVQYTEEALQFIRNGFSHLQNDLKYEKTKDGDNIITIFIKKIIQLLQIFIFGSIKNFNQFINTQSKQFVDLLILEFKILLNIILLHLRFNLYSTESAQKAKLEFLEKLYNTLQEVSQPVIKCLKIQIDQKQNVQPQKLYLATQILKCKNMLMLFWQNIYPIQNIQYIDEYMIRISQVLKQNIGHFRRLLLVDKTKIFEIKFLYIHMDYLHILTVYFKAVYSLYLGFIEKYTNVIEYEFLSLIIQQYQCLKAFQKNINKDVLVHAQSPLSKYVVSSLAPIRFMYSLYAEIYLINCNVKQASTNSFLPFIIHETIMSRYSYCWIHNFYKYMHLCQQQQWQKFGRSMIKMKKISEIFKTPQYIIKSLEFASDSFNLIEEKYSCSFEQLLDCMKLYAKEKKFAGLFLVTFITNMMLMLVLHSPKYFQYRQQMIDVALEVVRLVLKRLNFESLSFLENLMNIVSKSTRLHEFIEIFLQMGQQYLKNLLTILEKAKEQQSLQCYKNVQQMYYKLRYKPLPDHPDYFKNVTSFDQEYLEFMKVLQPTINETTDQRQNKYNYNMKDALNYIKMRKIILNLVSFTDQMLDLCKKKDDLMNFLNRFFEALCSFDIKICKSQANGIRRKCETHKISLNNADYEFRDQKRQIARQDAEDYLLTKKLDFFTGFITHLKNLIQDKNQQWISLYEQQFSNFTSYNEQFWKLITHLKPYYPYRLLGQYLQNHPKYILVGFQYLKQIKTDESSFQIHESLIKQICRIYLKYEKNKNVFPLKILLYMDQYMYLILADIYGYINYKKQIKYYMKYIKFRTKWKSNICIYHRMHKAADSLPDITHRNKKKLYKALCSKCHYPPNYEIRPVKVVFGLINKVEKWDRLMIEHVCAKQ